MARLLGCPCRATLVDAILTHRQPTNCQPDDPLVRSLQTSPPRATSMSTTSLCRITVPHSQYRRRLKVACFGSSSSSCLPGSASSYPTRPVLPVCSTTLSYLVFPRVPASLSLLSLNEVKPHEQHPRSVSQKSWRPKSVRYPSPPLLGWLSPFLFSFPLLRPISTSLSRKSQPHRRTVTERQTRVIHHPTRSIFPTQTTTPPAGS